MVRPSVEDTSEHTDGFFEVWAHRAGDLEDLTQQVQLMDLDRPEIALTLVRNPALGYQAQQKVVQLLSRAKDGVGTSGTTKTYALIIAFLIRNPNPAQDLRLELARHTVSEDGLAPLIARAWETHMGLAKPVLDVLLRSSVPEIRSFATGVDMAVVEPSTEFARKVRHASLPPAWFREPGQVTVVHDRALRALSGSFA